MWSGQCRTLVGQCSADWCMWFAGFTSQVHLGLTSLAVFYWALSSPSHVLFGTVFSQPRFVWHRVSVTWQWVGQSAVLSVGRAECCVAKQRSPDPKGGRYCEQSCIKKKVFMVTNCPVHLFFCLDITYSLLCHLQMYLSLHLNSSTMASSLYAVHARRC